MVPTPVEIAFIQTIYWATGQRPSSYDAPPIVAEKERKKVDVKNQERQLHPGKRERHVDVPATSPTTSPLTDATPNAHAMHSDLPPCANHSVCNIRVTFF